MVIIGRHNVGETNPHLQYLRKIAEEKRKKKISGEKMKRKENQKQKRFGLQRTVSSSVNPDTDLLWVTCSAQNSHASSGPTPKKK